jgi:hypothetical protein
MLQPSFEVEQPLQLYNKILLINFDEQLIMPLFIKYIKELIPEKINILRIQELRKKTKFYNLNYCVQNRELNYTYNELVRSKEEALRINIAKNFFHTNKVGYNTKFLGWLNFALPVKSMMKVFRKISCTRVTKPLIIYYGMCLAVQFQVLKMLNKSEKEIEANLRQTIDYGINCGILNKLIDQMDLLMLQITKRVKHVRKEKCSLLQIERNDLIKQNISMAPHIQYLNQKEFFNLLLKNYYNYPHDERLAFLKKTFFEINSGHKITSKQFKDFKNTLYLLGATTSLLNSISHVNRYNNGRIKKNNGDEVKNSEYDLKGNENERKKCQEKEEENFKNNDLLHVQNNNVPIVKNVLSCRFCEKFKLKADDFEVKIHNLEKQIRNLTQETIDIKDEELLFRIYKHQELYIKIIDHFINLYTLAQKMKIRDSKLYLSNKWLDEVRATYIDKGMSQKEKFIESKYNMFYLKINIEKIVGKQGFFLYEQHNLQNERKTFLDENINKLSHRIYHDVRLISVMKLNRDQIYNFLKNKHPISNLDFIFNLDFISSYSNEKMYTTFLQQIEDKLVFDKDQKKIIEVQNVEQHKQGHNENKVLNKLQPQQLIEIKRNIDAKKKIYINYKKERKREIRKMLQND